MGFFIGKVTHGRPDCTGRDEREIAVYDMLDSLGVEYDHIDHDEASTNALCEDIEKVLGVHICKNLFLCECFKLKSLGKNHVSEWGIACVFIELLSVGTGERHPRAGV